MKENENKLNLAYAVEAIVKAYDKGVLSAGDASDVESCILESLHDYYDYFTGSSLVVDFNELGFNESLLKLILRSIRDYPECNDPLVRGYSDCWWLFDNNGNGNDLETFCYESDWMKRCTEIFLDYYDYHDSVVEIFSENLDIEALVREYELEVESDDE